MVIFTLTEASTHVHADPQIDAAQGLIQRVLGASRQDLTSSFNLVLIAPIANQNDVFEVETRSTNASFTSVDLRGSSGVALASAFHYYLRYHCNSSVTWGRNRSGIHVDSAVSQPLPTLASAVRIESPAQWRYYLNFCTTSYSLGFASLEQWLSEVDWMALHGINLPLATIGTEHVISEAYGPNGLGLTETELLNFFPGAAFLAWNRMSNLDGPWGGPLTKDWRDRRADISAKVFDRMRSFGMSPVLPGFSGHVPCALQRVFPSMKLAPRPKWQEFNSSCLLDPTDPHFHTIALAFYDAQRRAFGPTRFFAADQFNEMTPADNATLAYLTNQSASVYAAMKAFEQDAVWVMQAWFLVSIALCTQGQTAYCGSFWLQDENGGPAPSGTYPRAQAYLSGVEHGKLLLLDLEANLYPVYNETENFYGHSFVWCMIHNFGQTPGVWGDLSATAFGPARAMAAAPGGFRGVGLTMEGIHNNPVIYEIMAEQAWRGLSRQIKNVEQWAAMFAQSRYGSEVYSSDAADAWRMMTDPTMTSPYSSSNPPTAIICTSASLDLTGSGVPAPPPQNATLEVEIFRALFRAAERAAGGVVPSTLRYDLVDMARQSLDHLLWDVSRLFEAAYNRSSVADAVSIATAWKKLALDLDAVLSTDSNFMIGPWLSDARATAGSAGKVEEELLDYNARNQITIWGPVPGTGLEDYARKMWGGLVRSYHVRGRWGILLDAAVASLQTQQPVNLTRVRDDTEAFELAWQSNQTETFPVVPEEDTMRVVRRVIERYADPSLAASGYTAVSDATVSESLDLTGARAWSHDVGNLAFLCSVDPSCGGFTSDGMLKRAFDPSRDVRPSQGSTLYIRNKKAV